MSSLKTTKIVHAHNRQSKGDAKLAERWTAQMLKRRLAKEAKRKAEQRQPLP
jgi:hypothetical protein